MYGSGISRDGQRRASRARHASRGQECECGRVVFGNGRVSHYRRCRPYLRKHGWPFDDATEAEIRRQAREAAAHIEDPDKRHAAWLAYVHQVHMDEARLRGLLAEDPAEARRKTWREIAERLANRMANHAYCPDQHPVDNPADECPFCEDRAAYLAYRAKAGLPPRSAEDRAAHLEVPSRREERRNR